jgi:NADPH:quinone reductase-like Zn-dependent oxidoreductase
MAWDLLVDRTDLARTSLVEVPEPVAGPGEALLRVDRVGLTANNATYAVFGDTMRYWDFFPAPAGTGRVPLWGFATVVASSSPLAEVGQQVYGYLPSSSHLVVTPGRGPAFRDVAPHRAELAAVYNSYLPKVVADTHDGDLQLLYRPLFGTAFLLADLIASSELFGATQVVFSSASSKTAYCTAALLRGTGRLVGLTSAANLAFVESLGVYDETRAYDDIESVSTEPTTYVDLAGSAPLRSTVHHHLGDLLVHSAVVGATQFDAGTGERLPGPPPTFFFAPDRIVTRTADWGPDGFRERYDAAWAEALPSLDSWVDVVAHSGPEALGALWPQVLTGEVAPRDGHVIGL